MGFDGSELKKLKAEKQRAEEKDLERKRVLAEKEKNKKIKVEEKEKKKLLRAQEREKHRQQWNQELLDRLKKNTPNKDEIRCRVCKKPKASQADKYCSNCGANLIENTKRPDTGEVNHKDSVKICTNCKYEISSKSKFCPNCQQSNLSQMEINDFGNLKKKLSTQHARHSNSQSTKDVGNNPKRKISKKDKFILLICIFLILGWIGEKSDFSNEATSTYRPENYVEHASDRQDSCYSLGYRFGRCATLTYKGRSCPSQDDFVMPDRCKGTGEAERGITAGAASVW